MDFKELLRQAQAGNSQAKEAILDRYKPLLLRESIENGVFDEDLYQELCITLLNCIRSFRI